MDPELKALLTALAEGQVKLAEGQAKTDANLGAFARDTKAAIGDLAGHVRDTHVALGELAGHVSELADHVVRLDKGQARLDEKVGVMAEALTDLGKRMDGYAKAVVKGFTTGAERNGKLSKRVEAVEGRLDKIEKRLPPRPRKRG